MVVLALDLGKRTGFCVGSLDEKPSSGAWVLGKSGDPHGAIFNQLIWALQSVLEQGVDLIVKEEYIGLKMLARGKGTPASVFVQSNLHGHVMTMGARYGVPVEDANMASVRKHFMGRARMGDRDSTKAAVVHRAQLLGYIPRASTDNDRADACAVFDWAMATFGRYGGQFRLFGEERQ